ncbi:lactonohydrolase [Tricladium varicosporioides]|nr:lactonohydrolase [Hymenoscyphus varicosporioides]
MAISALLLVPLISLTPVVYSLPFSSTSNALTSSCGSLPFPEFLCLNRYGSVMPGNFNRPANNDITSPDTYMSTTVPDDNSFSHVSNATFLIFDWAKAQAILGDTPTYEFMFTITTGGHEAPVYTPNTNELYFSDLATGVAGLSQQVINLNNTPPTLGRMTASPPIYAPAGGRYRNGLIYYSAAGGNESLNNTTYRPGIYTLDPKTGKSEVLVNNYFGYYFNTCDDLDLDPEGNVWFTDLQYSYNVGLNTVAPQLEAATYRFNPKTGLVSLVEDSMGAPNGIAFSPGGKTLYISDSNADFASIDPRPPIETVQYLTYNTTGKRTVYAFDVLDAGSEAPSLVNKRAVYLAMDFVPDGLSIAANGYIVTGTGHGVDVLDEKGSMVLRIQTNYTAASIEFVGPKRDELWIVGHGGVSRVKWNLIGQPKV